MVGSATKSIKLNLFQQVMALWEEVCPYNAACLFQLRGQADFEALQEAIRESCQQAGVGAPVLNHPTRGGLPGPSLSRAPSRTGRRPAGGAPTNGLGPTPRGPVPLSVPP